MDGDKINNVYDALESVVVIPEWIYYVIPAIIVVAIVLIIVIKAVSRNKVYGRRFGALVSEQATVEEKNVCVSPVNRKTLVNSVVFETESGRKQYAIKNSKVYALICVGDKGRLSYRGNRFEKFDINM